MKEAGLLVSSGVFNKRPIICGPDSGLCFFLELSLVVKIMVPFWVPIIIRHLLFRVPKKRDPNFDNHPHVFEVFGTRAIGSTQ